MKTHERIPVTLLTGFLGSGKTTLLNYILTAQHGKRIAVIENEFGEIGIDNELVINAEEEIFEMNNGCICCTVRGDLIRILGRLIKNRDRFDAILIETTGLADPAPVAQTFFVDDEMRENFSLDAIVTLVDAKHIWHHLDENEDCQKQIAFADVILLNKIDLTSDAELATLKKRLLSMNSQARLHLTHQAQVDLSHILHVKAFDLDAKIQISPLFLEEELPYEAATRYALYSGKYRIETRIGPDPTLDLVIVPAVGDEKTLKRQSILTFSDQSIVLPSGKQLTPGEFLYRLDMSQDKSYWELQIEQAGDYVFYTQHLPEEFNWVLRDASEQSCQILNQEHFSAGHSHDDSIGSVGIERLGALDPVRFNAWLGDLLRNQGVDIFRMKGIIHFANSPLRFVFQGVHMLFDGKPDRPWEDSESRVNQLVFIGRNLDRTALNKGFDACLQLNPLSV
jgi:G3E family GTPase